MSRLLFLVALCACGRIDEQLGRVRDTFGTPELLPVSSDTAMDDDPSATSDFLQLFFSSNRDGDEDVWVATRNDSAAPWGAPQPVTGVNSSARDSTPEISEDGLTLRFASDRPSGASWDIWEARRADPWGSWEPPVPLSELNTTDDELPGAAISSQLLLILHASNQGETDLYVATRGSVSDPWSPRQPLTELNSTEFDANGDLDPEGLRIAFDSARPGGQGDLDLYLATRDDSDQPFSDIQPIDEVNSPNGDSDPWLSDDGRILLFASDRTGNMEIYEARK